MAPFYEGLPIPHVESVPGVEIQSHFEPLTLAGCDIIKTPFGVVISDKILKDTSGKVVGSISGITARYDDVPPNDAAGAVVKPDGAIVTALADGVSLRNDSEPHTQSGQLAKHVCELALTGKDNEIQALGSDITDARSTLIKSEMKYDQESDEYIVDISAYGGEDAGYIFFLNVDGKIDKKRKGIYSSKKMIEHRFLEPGDSYGLPDKREVRLKNGESILFVTDGGFVPMGEVDVDDKRTCSDKRGYMESFISQPNRLDVVYLENFDGTKKTAAGVLKVLVDTDLRGDDSKRSEMLRKYNGGSGFGDDLTMVVLTAGEYQWA